MLLKSKMFPILAAFALFVLALRGRVRAATSALPPVELSVQAEGWRVLVAQLGGAAGIPTPYMMAWMQWESGGFPCAVGEFVIPPKEYGLFQLNVDGDQDIASRASLRAACAQTGNTKAELQRQLRQLTTAEKVAQVQAGVGLIQKCRDRAGAFAAQAGIGWSQPDRWKLVKMYHNVPTWVAMLPQVTAQLGRPPQNFGEYRREVFKLVKFGGRLTPARFNQIFDQAEILGNLVAV